MNEKKFPHNPVMRIFSFLLPAIFLPLAFSPVSYGVTLPAQKDSAMVISPPYRLRKTAEQASSEFREARKKNDRKAMLPALLNEAEAQLELNKVQQADVLLGEASGLINEKEPDALTGKFYLLKTKTDKEKNNLEQAIREAQRALEIYSQLHDTAGMAGTYSQMGSIAWKKHDYHNAVNQFTRALDLYRLVHGDKGTGQTLLNLGIVYTDMNQFDQAEEYFRKSLEHYTVLKDPLGEANAFHYLGVYHFRRARLKEAEGYYQRAWEKRLSAGDTLGAVGSLINLIQVYRDLRQPQKAIEASDRAFNLARALGDSSLVANAGIQAGNALLASGEYVPAHEYFLKALLSALSISDSLSSSQAYSALGGLFYKIGDFIKSSSYFEKAAGILPERAGPERKAYLLNQWGNALLAAGNASEALAGYRKAFETLSALNDHAGEALYLKNAGRASSMAGKTDEALRYFNEALRMYQKAGDEKGKISVWNEKGSVLARTGRPKEAAACFDSLIFLARNYSDFQSLAMGLRKKADLLMQTGNSGAEALYLSSLEAAEKTGNREVLQPSVLALAGYYEHNNNYRQALTFFHRYMDLHDSIYAEKEKQQILFSQVNFEIKLRDEQLKKVTQRIESLEQEQAIALIALNRQKNINRLLVLVMVLILIILVLGYRQYAIKKKTAAMLAEQNETIRKMNTQLAESEESLRKINQTKDKFISIIAHDIRNPLSGIIGFTDIIERRPENIGREELQQINSLIRQSARQLYDLLDNLLYWARSQSGTVPFHPQPVDVHEIAEKTIKLVNAYAASKNISLRNHIAPGTRVMADANMVTVIIRNLLSNALKFTGNGGFIEINSASVNGYLEVMVKDTGIGMRPEQVNRLFSDRNRMPAAEGTNQEKGSGLGLILCREFTEKHGGTIRAESEPGKGTVITFTLPLLPD